MKSALTLIILVLSLQQLAAQNVDNRTIIATVDGDAITVGEFRSRYALSIFPLKDRADLTPVVKRHFLYSLLAERLLAAEARRRGLGAEDRFTRNYRMAEEMFVRDKLYRDSIRSTVNITQKEILDRYLEEEASIEMDFLLSRDEAGIRNLSRLMKSGVPFDSLLAEQQRQNDGDSTRLPVVGDVEQQLLEQTSALRPGEVSEPLRIQSTWYLIRKRDHGNPLRTQYELGKYGKRIESDIRSEKEALRTAEFVRSCWRGDTARLNEDAYRHIGDALLRHYRAQATADSSDMLLAEAAVFEELYAQYAVRLEEAFASTAAGRLLSIGEFLDRLQSQDLRLPKADAKLFPQLFAAKVRDILDRMKLTRLGYRVNVHQSDEVRGEMASWSANGLAQMIPEVLWEQFIADDDSVWNYFISHPKLLGQPPHVLLLEVLVAGREEAEKIKAEVESGADMRTIAVGLSIREGAAARRGEFGWFSVAEHGKLGRTAFGMLPGDRAGPLETAEGWSFFQLLGKRRVDDKGVLDWNSLRDSLEAKLRDGLIRQKTDSMLKDLAGRGKILINEELFERVDVQSMQMFTIRHMGFGGRIPAVPSLMPLHEAVMEGLSRSGAQPSP